MLDGLAGCNPALDTVAHDAHVGVSRGDRAPRGLVRRGALRVGAIEDQLGAFVGRQRRGDIVLIVAAE